MTRLRIGIVGCGEVTQVIHLPTLRQLAERFEVTALCDVSPGVLEGVAAEIPGARRHVGYESLASDPQVDAVLVANPAALHADVALAAMSAGKDVLIEKPMCLTLAEADALAEAERRTGRIVQIGYMRRYAGAFLEAVEALRDRRDRIQFARVNDIIGQNRLIVDSTATVLRDPERPAALDVERREREGLEQMLGQTDGALPNVYSMLLGLGSHDLSAMRELLGRPLAVLHAAHRDRGNSVVATFDYGSFVCQFAIGVDAIARYDTYIEVFCTDAVLRLDYDTPYVRHLPARLSIQTANGAGVRREDAFPSRLDAFVSEWIAFHDCCTSRRPPRTGIADSKADLEIITEMMRQMISSDGR